MSKSYLYNYVKDNFDELVQEGLKAVEKISSYSQLSDEERLDRVVKFFSILQGGLEGESVQNRLTPIGKIRARQDFPLLDIMKAFNGYQKILHGRISKIEDVDKEDVFLLNAIILEINIVFSNIYLKTRDEIIAAQRLAIMELSTPLLPLAPSVLLLPLIGVVDATRVRMIAQHTLKKLSETKTDFLIIDVSNIPIVDEAIVKYAYDCGVAATCMGTRIIGTGVKPSIALMLGELDLDLSPFRFCHSLEEGINLAFSSIKKG